MLLIDRSLAYLPTELIWQDCWRRHDCGRRHAMRCSDSWPLGVTTASDMRRYAETLFGTDKTVENLLQGTCFADRPHCFVFRVKDACAGEDWTRWPELIEHAMKHTMMAIGNEGCIHRTTAI